MNSKMRIVLALVVVMFMFSVNVFAASIAKIGAVNKDKVLNTSDHGKDIVSTLKELNKKMMSNLNAKNKDYTDLSKKLEREAVVMSEEARGKMERQKRQMENDLNALRIEYEKQMRMKQQELMIKISKDIDEIVQKIGKKEGYLLIVDRRSVIYCPEEYDITDKVITGLNAAYKKKKK